VLCCAVLHPSLSSGRLKSAQPGIARRGAVVWDKWGVRVCGAWSYMDSVAVVLDSFALPASSVGSRRACGPPLAAHAHTALGSATREDAWILLGRGAPARPPRCEPWTSPVRTYRAVCDAFPRAASDRQARHPRDPHGGCWLQVLRDDMIGTAIFDLGAVRATGRAYATAPVFLPKSGK
jgi:hypothetical protein